MSDERDNAGCVHTATMLFILLVLAYFFADIARRLDALEVHAGIRTATGEEAK